MRIIIFLLSLICFSANAQDLSKQWEYYNQRQYDLVLEQTLPLLKDYSENMNLNMLIGRTYTDKSNFLDALPFLKKVNENDTTLSNRAWSSVFLGACYFYIDSLALAKEYLTECINLNTTPKATESAVRLKKDFYLNPSYDNWTVIIKPNIRFHFQNPNYSKEYMDIMENTYNKLNSFFNAKLVKKIDLFIWDNPDEAKRKLKRELAFSWNSMMIVHTLYNHSFGHELTHILCFWGFRPKNANLLINEGVATYFDQTTRDRYSRAKEATQEKEINVIDLWSNPSNYSESYYYSIGGALIDFLFKNSSEQQIKEIIKDQSINNARKVYSNFDDLMIGFNKKINGTQNTI